MKWFVIAIDWQQPNVLSEWDDEQQAKAAAERLDELALRAIAVPEGHPMIKDES